LWPVQRADLPDVADFAALQAKKRRLLFTLAGNLLLLVVMVGGPWLRGYLRARQSWRDFGRFTACLYGGKPSLEPGLGLPRGSEAHFAARVFEHAADWPERCKPLLTALKPNEPIFLLPGVKRAEADVRAAVALVENELKGLAVRVPGERLSNRPLRALEHLRAALSRHALEAGALDVPEADAFQRGPRAPLPIPTRVPIYASSDARIAAWGADSDFHALAVDHTGVSYVRVGGGGLEQARLPRPKLLEAFLPGREQGWLVWAMPRARCRDRAAGCSQKTIGLAPLTLPLTDLPAPRWFGAHPAGRVDRSVWVRGGRALVAAELEGRQLEVRELLLPAPDASGSAGNSGELPPLPASQTWRGTTAGDPWVVEIAGEPWVLAVRAGASATELVRLTPQGVQVLAQQAAGDGAWLTGAACDGGASFGFGNRSVLALGTIGADGTLVLRAPLSLSLDAVVHDSDAAHDRVRSVCTRAGGPLALVRDAKDNLLAISCEGDPAAACQSRVVAGGVQTFAALALEGQVLVAYAGAKNMAQLRVQRLAEGGESRGPERVPAPCWAPAGGLCGTPLLEQVGARILLGAREGTDVLVLESADQGQSWQPLRGLKRNDSQAL
jgi:hypothetical protein